MTATLGDFAWRVRGHLFRSIREDGAMPSAGEIAAGLDAAPERVTGAFEALAAAHVLVLDPDGSVLMAHPFAGAPTGFRVETPQGIYEANCAWDALAIPLLLGTDGVTPTRCPETGEAFDLTVCDGRAGPPGAVVRFPVPARRFWDDIHFT